MDFSQWSIPVARLPTIVTTQVAGHLPYPVPVAPTSISNGNLSTDALPTPEVLNAVAAALTSTDIRHVRLRHSHVPLNPQPGSLEYAIVRCNQHAFAYAARPATAARQQQTTAGAQQSQVQQQQQQQAVSSTKPARRMPAKETQMPPPKRRKRATATDEEYVSRTLDVQQIADEVAIAVSSFLEKAEALAAEREASEAEPDSDDETQQQQQPSSSAAAGHARRLSKPFLPLELLKELQASLSQGKQAGVVKQLAEDQLRQVLKVLLSHVQLGDGRLLDEHDTASCSSTKAVAASLEAACCCLQLLAAPGLSTSLYLDELLTATVQMAKYQLQYNVLAFYHPPYRQLYRPSSAVADDAPTTAGKKRARAEPAGKVPRVVNEVRVQLELLLKVLAQVVDRVLLEVELLLPLVRVALTCLQVDCLQLLQVEAVALTVAVFRSYPQQRQHIMDEVLTTVIANITVVGSRGPMRLLEATDPDVRPMPIMMATALIMQLVEVSVALPPVDAAADSIRVAFQGAYRWSDVFWKGVFARLPAAKAAKSDGASDFKQVMEALVADLLTVQMLPEWPVATIMLRRFTKVLSSDSGLKHTDTAVKQASVEFTGQLTARLWAEALIAEQTAEEVEALLGAAEAAAGDDGLQSVDQAPERRQEQLLNRLHLDYLTAAHSTASYSITASARRFLCCRMLNDTIYATNRGVGEAKLSEEQLSLLLVQHRQLQDSTQRILGPGVSHPELSRAQHVSLVRWWVVHGPLGAGRATLIKWLLEAGSREGKDPNPATVRTKVFKCLGCVVESDSRVLGFPDVSAAVRAALEDDSVAVRETALELLAKLIHSNSTLAGDYFDVLVQASHDAGVSVRKRAIRSLWDCCSCPGFTRATEAVVVVLQRALDQEESMRALVTKFCGDMWFLEGSSFAGLADTPSPSSPNGSARTADIRARELADVAVKAYEAGGKAIHVPLGSDYPLVVILKEVLGTGSSGGGAGSSRELSAVRAGAAQVAEALLNMVLQQQDPDGDEDASTPSNITYAFPYLLALHALCCADAGLAAPEVEPQRFLMCLTPYISAAAAAAQQGGITRTNSTASGSTSATPSDDPAKRSAEECLCLLAVIDGLLRHLAGVEQEVLKKLMTDLLVLTNKHKSFQVLKAACQVLCTMAPRYAATSDHISQLMTRCYGFAHDALKHQQGHFATSAAVLMTTPRILFIMGQLCQHGAAHIDAAAAADTSRRNCTECMELCVALWQQPGVPGQPIFQRIRDAALQAMGMLVIGKPQLMLQPLQLHLLGEQQPAAEAAAAANRVSDRGSPCGGEASDVGISGAEQQAQQQQSTAGPGPMQRCAAEVYNAALATGSISVKSRVLANLVELLRSEEVALVSRQKDTEAASAGSRLASTKPNEVKAPLAKVNGAADAAADSSSSSIVQRIWQDVLKLATGVSSIRSNGSSAAVPGAAAAATAAEAAQMRRKALELIEVVLRAGLVAPWTAVAPLVAQLTDEAVDTRQAALKALRGAADKYPDYVAGQLAPGVIEAYNFQSRLWAAKHPGQPMPNSPGASVLEGLGSMYTQVIAAAAAPRSRFLLNLLKPFAAACSLADSATAAREDVHKLAFITCVAASLPFKKADEPLVLIHSINSYISRQAQEVLDCLRLQLLKQGLGLKMGLGEQDDDIDAAAVAVSDTATTANQYQEHQQLEQQQQGTRNQQNGRQGLRPLQLPFQQELLAPLKASLALSMLLALKQYTTASYSLTDDRIAAFELKGERYRAEQKALVCKAKSVGDFVLHPIDLRCQADATGDLLVEHYRVFKGLVDNDAANYKEAAVLAGLEDAEEEQTGLEAAHVGTTPAVGAGAAKAAGNASTGLLLYSMDHSKKAARIKCSAKGGSMASKGGSTTAKRGKARGSTTGKKGRGGSTRGKGRKRRRSSDTEDSDEEFGPIPSKELF